MSSTMTNRPILEIVEEPVALFRYRYSKEGKHGTLTEKSFPTVYLHNFKGEALIRCSPCQILESEKRSQNKPVPHSHRLVVRCGNKNKKDPHEVNVSRDLGYEAKFQKMEIMRTLRTDIITVLHAKLLAKAKFESGRTQTNTEIAALLAEARKIRTGLEINKIGLCFEAYEWVNNKWKLLCEPVISNPINNSGLFMSTSI